MKRFWANKKNQPNPPEDYLIFSQKPKPKLSLVERPFLGKPIWDWLGLVGGFSIIVTGITFVVNLMVEQNKESQRYYQELVKDHTEYISKLISNLNEEKDDNREIRRIDKIDLKNADLRGADLRNADLRNADLTGANLRKADLRGAILPPELQKIEGANLENALYDFIQC